MRYASIRSMDISNGEGVGISLFVQGCHFHCKNCFNKDTWDFNGGKEWIPEIEDKFIELASRPYIKRISILGGEPLTDENLDGVLNLVNRIRLLLPEKTIWLYTGYRVQEVDEYNGLIFNRGNEDIISQFTFSSIMNHNKRSEIARMCNILVDGRYIDSQRNISAKWRGSSNQRVIDIQESLKQNKVVLYCD